MYENNEQLRTRTHARTHAGTHTHTLPPSLPPTLTHSLSLSLSLLGGLAFDGSFVVFSFTMVSTNYADYGNTPFPAQPAYADYG